MLLLNNLCFSQNNTTTNTQTAAEFESNTSYFNDSVNSDTSNTSFQSTSTTKVVIKMIVVLVLVVAALYAMMHFFKKKNNVTIELYIFNLYFTLFLITYSLNKKSGPFIASSVARFGKPCCLKTS